MTERASSPTRFGRGEPLLIGTIYFVHASFPYAIGFKPLLRTLAFSKPLLVNKPSPKRARDRGDVAMHGISTTSDRDKDHWHRMVRVDAHGVAKLLAADEDGDTDDEE